MKVRFWGVRGSVPTPWKEAIDVGGNTSCVQIEPKNSDEIIILDAGTGIRFLGEQLMKQKRKLHCHLLLSHAHWDHIQGFPFFVPAYIPGNQVSVYGATRAQKTIQETLSGQMTAPYFPVGMGEMRSQLDFVNVEEGDTLQVAGLTIKTCGFHHPGGVLGFRIEDGEHVVVFATDMEYSADDLDPSLIEFSRDADLLIYDAQYTPEEFEQKRGWGHSTHIAAAHLGQLAQVKKVILYHHDPSHSDTMLEQMESEAREIFPHCQLAKEGTTLALS